MGERQSGAHNAVVRARRTVEGASAQISERLAGAVRTASPERLAQLMRTPARRLVLETIFWQMPQFVDRRQSRKLNASVRWIITGRPDGGADVYDLTFTEGRCRVSRGDSGPKPPVTITVDGVEFLKIAVGGSDPMRAYFQGRLAIAGNIMVAAKLVSVLRIPSSRR